MTAVVSMGFSSATFVNLQFWNASICHSVFHFCGLSWCFYLFICLFDKTFLLLFIKHLEISTDVIGKRKGVISPHEGRQHLCQWHGWMSQCSCFIWMQLQVSFILYFNRRKFCVNRKKATGVYGLRKTKQALSSRMAQWCNSVLIAR